MAQTLSEFLEQNSESLKEKQSIFETYLDTVALKKAKYTTEILQDKLIIRCNKKGKVKLELNVQTIAPLLSFETALIRST